ncbi:hypothetical protein CULT_2420001 [[Clostridium] ultunense Esp]|nr:hypothetical protein CULT_2420001 [[Clostridium] ultunense Esp]
MLRKGVNRLFVFLKFGKEVIKIEKSSSSPNMDVLDAPSRDTGYTGQKEAKAEGRLPQAKKRKEFHLGRGTRERKELLGNNVAVPMSTTPAYVSLRGGSLQLPGSANESLLLPSIGVASWAG